MTARIDTSGIYWRGISAARRETVAAAYGHLLALRETLAGGPLPLASEQARLLEVRSQHALELVMDACRLADWLEAQAAPAAGAHEARYADFFENLLGEREASSASVEEPQAQDPELAVVRQRVAQIDETAGALESVLRDCRGPILVAVALRDRQQVEAIVDAAVEVIGQLGATARALCGSDVEVVDEER